MHAELLTLDELIELFHPEPRWARAHAARNRIPHVRVGSHFAGAGTGNVGRLDGGVRYDPTIIEAWLPRVLERDPSARAQEAPDE